MSNSLLAPVGAVRAQSGKPADHPFEPAQRSTVVHAHNYHYAMEMHRERLRQAEAQRLRRAAWRARRSLAARLLG